MLTQSVVLLFCVGVVVSIEPEAYNETLDVTRPLRDRFRLIINNIDSETLNDEIEHFTAYNCEKMVVIKNQAEDDIHISCQSHHDSPKPATVKKGNAYAFSFKPLKNGESKFWCTVEYKQQFVRFDVYNEDLSYMCPRDINEVHQYVVHHDGVYVDKSKGSKGQKIRALMKGHNKFILWEEFKEGKTDGFLVSGLIDGGMCYDIPEQFNDKTAAVTVCYNHCVHLYEHYGCQGKVQTVQAVDDCQDVGLSEELGNKLSAIQGC